MVDDFDDLLIPTREQRLTTAEVRLAEAKRQAEIRLAGKGVSKIDDEEFLVPVSQNKLARWLNMDPATVKKRLRGCRVAGTVGNGRPVYYFHEALPWLIKPKMDLATYIKSLNPADMPNSINKVFWEAERIKNKVMIETGQAWPTERVLDVFGTVFMTIKDRIPLISDALFDMGCTEAQMTKLREMCDQFQADLHKALVEMSKVSQTHSRAADIDTGELPIEDDDA